ncbi:hypothetical protein CYB_1352 [Synechococcus sp. JA-2-3B'a(2-13)]|nr:hypothetical protein CYB_1352 [Synechococcus sp. JA-2-3B'a(2-13)]
MGHLHHQIHVQATHHSDRACHRACGEILLEKQRSRDLWFGSLGSYCISRRSWPGIPLSALPRDKG